jgi:hypothetical protein
VPGDDGDFVAGGGERGGKRVHVPAEAADHNRRIFPGKHQHPLPPGWSYFDHVSVQRHQARPLVIIHARAIARTSTNGGWLRAHWVRDNPARPEKTSEDTTIAGL